MKLGKYEINVNKENPVVVVKKNGNPLFHILKNKKTPKPVAKSKKPLLIIATVGTSIAIGVGAIVGFSAVDDVTIANKTPASSIQNVLKEENNVLDFYVKPYGDKHYLALEEEDFLYLIEQAMSEVDEEYLNNGNKTVFNSQDREYSQFTSYDILAVMQTETSFRLLEIKDENKSIYDINNYARFYGKDEKGVIYYGSGMISQKTIDYIVETDRKQVNGFDEYINVDGRNVEMSFENLNAYDYVLESGAKTKKEIEQALKENILLNAKSIYIYLNRIVKDNVKAGTHDEELNKLEEYPQLSNLSTEDKQKVFALIGYNNGPTITGSKMMDGTLFEKYTTGDKKGKYVLNVAYASKVLNKSLEYSSKLENSTNTK